MNTDLLPEGNRRREGNARVVKGKETLVVETANENPWRLFKRTQVPPHATREVFWKEPEKFFF